MVGLLCVCVKYEYRVRKIARFVIENSRGGLALVECINHVYKVVGIVRIVREISVGGGEGGGLTVCQLYI